MCHSECIKAINIYPLNISPSKNNTHINKNVCSLIILQSSLKHGWLYNQCVLMLSYGETLSTSVASIPGLVISFRVGGYQATGKNSSCAK